MENIVEKTPNQIWLEELGKKPTELTLDDIISYCQANNKVEWLKATAKKMVTVQVYPRLIDENGKKTNKADKSKPPVEKEVKIPFTMIRNEFIEECMPEVKKPKAPKKLSMYDIIEAL